MDRNKYQEKRSKLLEERSGMQSNLDLSQRRQLTHFIVPADNEAMIEKALVSGCSRAPDILMRNGITLDEVAAAMETTAAEIERIIDGNPYPDLILIDGEDATSLNEDSIKKSRENTVNALNAFDIRHSAVYFRPSGLELEYFIDDVLFVLENIRKKGQKFPLAGIVMPKVESPGEIELLTDILDDFEKKSQLDANSIKIQFLIESTAGLLGIAEIARKAARRLSGIIFGMADYASETGISGLDEKNPVFQNAKIQIVNASKAHGVPAIDCMNFDYPVASKNADRDSNRKKILASLRNLQENFLYSANLGMDGKWVGHPLQLLAIKLAAHKLFPEEKISIFLEKLGIYSGESSGAQMIHGEMADRATDRNVKAYLRKAAIYGCLDLSIALKNGIITNSEYHNLRE